MPNRPGRGIGAGLGVLAGLALAACGSGAGEGAATVTVTKTVTASPSPSSSVGGSASASPSESPSEDSGPVIKEPGQWAQNSYVKFRVLRMASHLTSGNPYIDDDAGRGNHWAGLLAQGCVKPGAGDPFELGWDNWSLLDRRGGEYEGASSSWDTFPPAPQYPLYETVKAGECIKGWVLMPVKDGARIGKARFSSSGNGTFAYWDLR